MSKIAHEVLDGVFIVTVGEYDEGKSPYAVFNNYETARICAKKLATRSGLFVEEADETGLVYKWTDAEVTLIVKIQVFDVLETWEVG